MQVTTAAKNAVIVDAASWQRAEGWRKAWATIVEL